MLLCSLGLHSQQEIVKEKLTPQAQELFQTLQSTKTDPKEARSSVRQYNVSRGNITWFDKSLTKDLASDFKTFETFFNSRDGFSPCKKPFAYMRYCVALFCAVLGIPAFLLFLPTALVFLIYSWCYPLIELVRALVQHDFSIASIATLPLCLTLAYLSAIALMLCLAPTIYTFNRMCTDIVPLTGSRLPPQFYDVAVVKRIETVFHAELSWQHLVSQSQSHSLIPQGQRCRHSAL